MRIAKLAMALSAAFICSLLVCTHSFAQSSSISGTIVDPSGTKLPAVGVTLTNTATGIETTVATDATGTYKFSDLPAGSYKLSTGLNDFDPYSISNINLGAADTQKLDIQFTLGTAARIFRTTHPFFAWSENTWLGKIIRSHQYPFAIIEVVHLFGLTLLLGGIFLMSLRLFGLIMRDMPVPQVARQLGWISFTGLFVMATTGISLFTSEALKCYGNTMYWYKMAFFFPATIFHFTLYRKVTRSNDSQPFMRGLTGFLALFLWFGVAVFGRAIGYF